MVGVWANRNWILGNLLKEISLRTRSLTKIHWVLSVFANKSPLEILVKFPLPHYPAYFFSYPTIFKSYLLKYPKRLMNNSIVLYTHHDSELGDYNEQARYLNEAFRVYFMNNKAAEILRLHGLKKDKVRIVQFAIDNDCFLPRSIRKNKTIILASKFSPRKGLHLLPDLVQSMPDWNFIVLGRDWENFVASTSLREVQNFTLHEFTKESRNKYFSEAFIFLSLSEIEGGPIPLLEAMAFGLVPVCTQTGFAPDLIEDGKNGVLLPSNFSILDIKKALLKAAKLEPESSLDFNRFTWDRLSRILLSDFQEISESFKRSQDVNSF